LFSLVLSRSARILFVFASVIMLALQPSAQTTTEQFANRRSHSEALIASTNSSGVLMWRTDVSATEPIESGVIFVDQHGYRTAIALDNASDQDAPTTLVLRDAVGKEIAQRVLILAAHQQATSFVDELFVNMPDDFIVSLTFESQDKLAAVSLRETQNSYGYSQVSHSSVRYQPSRGEA